MVNCFCAVKIICVVYTTTSGYATEKQPSPSLTTTFATPVRVYIYSNLNYDPKMQRARLINGFDHKNCIYRHTHTHTQ